MTKHTDKYVNINGITTRYWADGEKGSVIVLIHGFAGSVEHWMENIDALSKKHRVYALDLIGFGYSDKPQNIDYSEELFVKFIKDFITQFDLKDITLVGHSLGGAIAIHFAIQHPELLKNLILVSSAGLGQQIPAHFRALTLPIVGDMVFHFNTKKLLGAAIRIHVFNKKAITDDFVQSMYDIFQLPDFKKTMLKIIRRYANFLGVRRKALKPILQNLNKIQTPTLIIWGREDNLIPITHANIAMRHLPNAKLHIFEKCGHMPQMEASEEFNKLIMLA